MKVTSKFSFAEYVDVRKVGFLSWPFYVNWTSVVIAVITAVAVIVVVWMVCARKINGTKRLSIGLNAEYGEKMPIGYA